MKGKTWKLSPIVQKDPDTGVPVTRLTDNEGDTYHPYFTMPLFTKEGESLLVASTRTGSGQLYRLYLKEHKLVQLTDEPEVACGSAVMDRAHNRIFYPAADQLKVLDLETLRSETLLHAPAGYKIGQLSITDDGDYLAFSMSEAFSYMEEAKIEQERGRLLSSCEHLYRRPNSVVIRYNAKADTYRTVWGENEWITHTNISPVDPNIILFCHEASWFLVQRMWIAKVATDEVHPLVEQPYNLMRVGHEFFTASGRIGAQFSLRHSPEVPFYLQGDLFVNHDGTQEMRYFYPYTRPNHVQLNHAETLGVGDRAHIRRVQPDLNRYMSLLRYHPETFRVEVGLLCAHNTTWKGQPSHPHAIFTPDDSHVLFSSQAGGKCNVYLAPADWEHTIKSDF